MYYPSGKSFTQARQQGIITRRRLKKSVTFLFKSILKKTIFTGFAPNLTARDVKTACGFLFLPWRWRHGRAGDSIEAVARWLGEYFFVKHALTFDSGRSALYYALRASGVGVGDEVLVQAYTCLVVINAIKWAGATPVYVDINDNFNINPNDLNKKITQRSKVLIIQHTFGQPADLDQLLPLAKQHGLKTIEDCAHALGAKYKGRLLGTFGDIGLFSFGSDKPVSCVRGGALITNDDAIFNKLTDDHFCLPRTARLRLIQHLFHYPVFFIGKNLYHLGIGKCLLWLAKKVHLISKIIYEPEKVGRPVAFYPALLPNALAVILLDQLKELDAVNQHRLKIARLYSSKIKNRNIQLPKFSSGSIPLRYPLLADNPKILLNRGAKQGVILGDWYNRVVAPSDSDLSKTGYKAGACPNAERLAARSVNLPTDRQITTAAGLRIINAVLNQYGD